MENQQLAIINLMTFSEWMESKFVEWRGARRRAVLAKVKPEKLHAFRRKHVLDMYRAGEKELTIQRRIGHRDRKTIARYIKFSREDLRKSAQRTRRARK